MDFQLTSASNSGDFIVVNQQQQTLTEIQYENWFSSTATAIIEGRLITIKARNIWWSNFDFFVDGKDLGDITFNWKGQIIVKIMTVDGSSRSYRLNYKGFWNPYFVLEDEQEREIMRLTPTFKWQKMRYSYDVNVTSIETASFDQTLLLVISGYAANLYMTMLMSAA